MLSAHDALLETDEKPDILKLGVTHPIPKEIITKFLKDHREVLILEELDDILEKEIKSLAFDRNINVTILSREGADEFIGEHTPDKVRSIIHRVWPGVAAEPPSVSTSSDIPPRPPRCAPDADTEAHSTQSARRFRMRISVLPTSVVTHSDS